MPSLNRPKTIQDLAREAWALDILLRRFSLGMAKSQVLAGVRPMSLAERNRSLLERFLGMA